MIESIWTAWRILHPREDPVLPERAEGCPPLTEEDRRVLTQVPSFESPGTWAEYARAIMALVWERKMDQERFEAWRGMMSIVWEHLALQETLREESLVSLLW